MINLEEFIENANRLVRTVDTPQRVAKKLGITVNALHIRMNKAGMRWQPAGYWVKKPDEDTEGEG